ncbi:MAG: hypothetical protein ACW98A_17310 [Candidatus Hodarchaeales archaeon]
MRKISRSGLIGLVIILVVGIILIVSGVVLQNSYPFASSTALYIIIPLIIIVLGWVFVVLAIIGGIYLVMKWSRKE